MPRDVAGNYTLPAGINPVVSDTLIDVNWANPTLDDIASQLNNVLTRDGLLGPTTTFKIQDGTEALPGLAFNSQSNTGWWRDATKAGFSYQGVSQFQASSSGLSILPAVTFVDAVAFGSSVSVAQDLSVSWAITPGRTRWYLKSVLAGAVLSDEDCGPGPLLQPQGTGTITITLPASTITVGNVLYFSIYSFALTTNISFAGPVQVFSKNSGVPLTSPIAITGVGTYRLVCIADSTFVYQDS